MRSLVFFTALPPESCKMEDCKPVPPVFGAAPGAGAAMDPPLFPASPSLAASISVVECIVLDAIPDPPQLLLFASNLPSLPPLLGVPRCGCGTMLVLLAG